MSVVPVIVNETADNEGTGLASTVSSPGLDQATAHCSKNGSQQEVDDKGKDKDLAPPSLRGYKQLRSNDGSSSESCTPASSANSSMLEPGANDEVEVEETCAASTSAVNSTAAHSTGEDNAVDADDEAGNISSLESSLSNYTDCESNFSSDDESAEFKSLNGTADEEERPLLPADGDEQVQDRRNRSGSESSDISQISASTDSGDVICLSTSTTSSSSSDSDVPVRMLNKTVSVPSNLPPLPADVEKENRKNIIKTMQGQAEIITNWSLATRSSDGRKMWMLMGGKAYDYANKCHNSVRPPCSGGNSIGLNVNKGAVVFPDCPHPPINSLRYRSVSPEASTSSHNRQNISKVSAAISKALSVINLLDDDDDEEEEEGYSNPSVKGDINDNGLTASVASAPPPDDTEMPKEYKGKRLYPCGKCDDGLYLVSKLCLYKHVIKEHGREERAKNRDVLYPCSRCPKQFGRKRSQRAHEKTHPHRGIQTVAIN